MNTLHRAGALALTCLSLSGCATIIRGAHTDVQVVSSPPGAKVQTAQGASCSPTPCTLRVLRKNTLTATVTLPGYKASTVQATPYMSTGGVIALFGNAFIGGFVGLAVDAISGATNDLSPSSLDVALERDLSGRQPIMFGQSTLSPSPLSPSPRYARVASEYAAPSLAYAGASSPDGALYGVSPPPQARTATIPDRVLSIRVLPDHSVQETRESDR